MPHVQVIVRCRPTLPHEGGMSCSRIEVNEIANTVVVSSSKQEAKSFQFDHVLPESCSQEDVFGSLSPMVDHALDGLHSTVFAYGQTGSGKTHTIEGFDYAADSHGRLRPKLDSPPQRHGVLPRVIQAVFDRARDRSFKNPNVHYRLKCSYMQLYNERVSDLLNPATRTLKEGLRIRWTRDDHFEVENLFVFECETAEQMREMMMMGVKEKVMSSHQMNQQSSRSHCIFTIHVHSWDTSNPDCVIKSELSLVDLAGSEKLALLSSNPSAQLLKESIEINTSLLSLGKVITALAASKTGSQHVPYRDSKLTKLLKHALGGNSMTAMIACIAPVDSYVDETLSTLLYAGRARNITTVPRINEDPRSALIRQLREEVQSLKTELEYYKQLAGASTGGIETRIDSAFLAHVSPKKQGSSHAAAATAAGQGPAATANSSGSGSLPPATQQALNGSTDSSPEQFDLAEKLVSACKMLKNVVGVNNQLRAAFDKLKLARDDAAQKELELNAENLALRERIEMLESIALSEESTSGPHATASFGSSGDPTMAASYSSAPPAMQGAGRHAQPSHRRAEPIPVTSTYATKGAAAVAAVGGRPRDAGSDAYVAPAVVKTAFDQPSGPPVRATAAADRLQDYTNKYRNPQKPTRYEDYYGAARSKATATAAASSTQAAQMVQELDRLLKHAPKATQMTVPISLQSAQAFGSLSFGGNDADTRDVEERRRLRQMKLQQLQAQHDTMQRGFSGGVVSLPTSSAFAPEFGTASSGRAGFGAHSSSGGGSALNFGGSLPAAAAAARGDVEWSSVTAFQPPPAAASSSSSTTKLFNYLSQEEASKMFTPEQQERLRLRGFASPATGSTVSTAQHSGRGSQPQHASLQGIEPLNSLLQKQLEQLRR